MQFKRLAHAGFFAGASLSLAACAAELSGPDRPDLSLELSPDMDAGMDCAPTLASIQSTVFTPLCASAGCHVGTRAAAALDLTRSDLERYLPTLSASSCEGRRVLVPGNPDASLLLSKIDGHLPSGCGDPMPPTGVALASAQVECVRGWIAGLKAVDAGVGDGGAGDGPQCESCGTASCVDVNTDPNHCQGCNIKCAAGQLCTPSGCSSAGCGSLTQCGSACVDTKTSALNCGACGKACTGGTTCNAGVCSCATGKTLCGTSCVDVKSDANNCGGCGVVCGGGKSCVQGSCACTGGPVAFSSVAPILVDNCTNAGCHTGNMPKEGLDLTASKAYAELVSVKASQCNDGRLLVPTNGAGKSYLLQKLTGQDMCSGSKMPKADSMLPPADMALIQAWICNGAQP